VIPQAASPRRAWIASLLEVHSVDNLDCRVLLHTRCGVAAVTISSR
jgi:hypothetical protein